MEIDMNDYDIDAIRGFFDDLREREINNYGTALSSFPFAMADLVDVDSKYDVSNKSDYEVIVMAYNMEILDNFYIGKNNRM